MICSGCYQHVAWYAERCRHCGATTAAADDGLTVRAARCASGIVLLRHEKAQFTLRRLFIAVTMIAVGLGWLAAAWHVRPSASVFILSGAVVGAGLMSLYRYPVLGAVVGACGGALLAGCLMMILFYWAFSQIRLPPSPAPAATTQSIDGPSARTGSRKAAVSE